MSQLSRIPSVSNMQSLATGVMCSVARYAHTNHKDPNDPVAIDSRRRIVAAAEQLLLEARDPLEQLFDLSGQMAENAAIRAAIGMGIFDLFSRRDSFYLSEIAHLTGAEYGLVCRIVRVLVTTRLVVVDNDQKYSLSRNGLYLKVPKYQSLFIFRYDSDMPSLTKLPEYLAETGWKIPSDVTDTPFHRGHHTAKPIFDYYAQDTNWLPHFNNSLAAVQEMNVYNAALEVPWPSILGQVASHDVALVDVGGANGHVLEQILNKYPQLPGRFVLQDLTQTVTRVPHDLSPRIEVIAHDFFTPQPIKGARAYHYRMVFHDWPLADCRRILRQVKSAMIPGHSKLLIGDLIIPDIGASKSEAIIDIMMMTLAAEEKSESTFKTLLESEGFFIRQIWRSTGGRDSIIEAEISP